MYTSRAHKLPLSQPPFETSSANLTLNMLPQLHLHSAAGGGVLLRHPRGSCARLAAGTLNKGRAQPWPCKYCPAVRLHQNSRAESAVVSLNKRRVVETTSVSPAPASSPKQLEKLQRAPVIGTLVSLPVVHSLLVGVLPGLALRIFVLLLPVLLYALNRRAGAVGQADMDGHVS